MAGCKSCDTPIVWRRSTNTQKPGPYDEAPAENGNVRFNDDGTATVLNRDQAAAARGAGEQLHLSHFATCPQASIYKRRNSG